MAGEDRCCSALPRKYYCILSSNLLRKGTCWNWTQVMSRGLTTGPQFNLCAMGFCCPQVTSNLRQFHENVTTSTALFSSCKLKDVASLTESICLIFGLLLCLLHSVVKALAAEKSILSNRILGRCTTCNSSQISLLIAIDICILGALFSVS